jgi:hypothetical protein
MGRHPSKTNDNDATKNTNNMHLSVFSSPLSTPSDKKYIPVVRADRAPLEQPYPQHIIKGIQNLTQ